MYYFRISVYNSQSAKDKGKKAFERILSYEKISSFPFEVIFSALNVLFGPKSIVTYEMSEDGSSDSLLDDFFKTVIDPAFHKDQSNDSKK